MLEGDALLDLRVLSLNPGILFIAMGMQLGQGSQAFFGLIVVDEPTGRLDHILLIGYQQCQGAGKLTSGNTIIKQPSSTAGSICSPRGSCH